MMRELKLQSFIPPAVVLVVFGVWIVNQRQTIATMEQESKLLSGRIATARSTANRPLDSSAAASGKTTKSAAQMDWKKIVAQLADPQHADGRTMLRMQQQVLAMTKEELISALDEVADMQLTDEARQKLEGSLIAQLIDKDPELALNHHLDRLADWQSVFTLQLAQGFQKWAGKDLAQATAWLNQQITAGYFDTKTLDGKSQSWINFEAGLVSAQLSTDPAAAASRVAGLPEDQRAGLIRGLSSLVKEKDPAAFAELVRGQLSAPEQASAFGQQASYLVQGGYAKVGDFLNQIAATPEERAACVEQAMAAKFRANTEAALTRDDFDAMRTWVAAEAPESLAKVTATALANAITGSKQKLDFGEAADLALRYSQGSGDEVLATFLVSPAARQNKEQARAYADQIVDAARREQVLALLK